MDQFDRLVLPAVIGSILLLGGAFAFQHLGGLAPCELCIWQRWPHAAAIFVAVFAMITNSRTLAANGALLMLAGAGIAFFHVGIEQGWWEGPLACTASTVTEGRTAEEVMADIMAAPLVRCDVVAWSFLGLSMAAWNGIVSLFLALLWVRAARSTD